MSGGQKISDHGFWAGKGKNGEVFPNGVHNKEFSSAEGAGEVSMYEDTTETIKAQQEMGIRKAKSHGMKTGYVN